ncbi:hypothetical protein [Saccharopolyspora mangrovi]|uniref:Uncharacterized protein n=1 Tax=Saccharopolyspora mangrovi TaxID=3082379 RepID=A0ABU6AKL2_9PSEU|nr:hypothetical protein [Saccharopolyspora sp. S2-29]MEB3371924.1 hypothetical protein [Saccharopolyspora sp. S2-29]
MDYDLSELLTTKTEADAAEYTFNHWGPSAVIGAVAAYLAEQPDGRFEGTAAELLIRLKIYADMLLVLTLWEPLPRSPFTLIAHLCTLRGGLRECGILLDAVQPPGRLITRDTILIIQRMAKP